MPTKPSTYKHWHCPRCKTTYQTALPATAVTCHVCHKTKPNAQNLMKGVR